MVFANITKKDFIGAIEDYDHSIKSGLNSSGVYYNKAVAMDCTGKFKEAIKLYNKAIQIDKKLDRAYFARGIAYLKIGNKEAAIQDVKKSLSLGYKKAQKVLEQLNN